MTHAHAPQRRFGGKDFIAGLILIALGIGAIVFSRSLDVGHLARVGPAFFIWLSSAGLILLGTVLSVAGAVLGSERIGGWPLRGLLFVTAAILCFGATLRGLGMLPACFLAYVISGCATPSARPAELAIAGAAMALLCAGVFVWGLGLPLPLFGRWLDF